MRRKNIAAVPSNDSVAPSTARSSGVQPVHGAPVTIEAPASPARSWSVYQEAVFANVREGTGHTVVLARAGSGKTTTIVEAMRHVPSGCSVLMVAFNKAIATELQSRAPAGVTVSTLHSYGYAAIRSAFGNVRLNDRKVETLVKARLGEETETREYRQAVIKAVGLAKGTLAEEKADIGNMIDSFGLEVDDGEREGFCTDVIAILDACKLNTKEIDFDDMVWFPVVFGLRVRRYDRVFVDETQDLNLCQIELALAACAEGGRICAVGDDRQAIYGFRGADARAVPRVINSLSATVLPLSVTYRCARAIVEVAREIVPDLEAAPNATEGEVLDCNTNEMKRDAKPGDFVLSRSNAPLIATCLAFLKAGKPATVAGRDIGAGLRALIEKSKARSVPALAAWLERWVDREIARVTKRNPDADTSAITDKAECIHALSEGAASVGEIVARIESLFSDRDPSEMILCATTHKAKGLERERVWMLADTYKAGRSVEEANLYYVAVTRAKRTLCMVTPAEA